MTKHELPREPEFWTCPECGHVNSIYRSKCHTCNHLNGKGYFGWIRDNLTIDSSRLDKDLGELSNNFNHARLFKEIDSFVRPSSLHSVMYEILVQRHLPYRKDKPTKHWERFVNEQRRGRKNDRKNL